MKVIFKMDHAGLRAEAGQPMEVLPNIGEMLINTGYADAADTDGTGGVADNTPKPAKDGKRRSGGNAAKAGGGADAGTDGAGSAGGQG